MADNMIELVAKLNTKDSESLIIKDIKTISNDLKTSPLEITCSLSSDSINKIQEQLSQIKINISGLNINESAINAEASRVANDIQRNISNVANINLSINTDAINNFANEMSKLNISNVDVDGLARRLGDLKVQITSISPAFRQAEQSGEQMLSTLTIKGKDAFGSLVNYVETYNKKTGAWESSTTKITQNLSKVEKAQIKIRQETENAQKALNEFLKLKGNFDVLQKQYGGESTLATQFQDISKLIAQFDNTAPLDKQREGIIRIDTALKLLKLDINDIKQAASNAANSVSNIYPSISYNRSDTSTTLLANAKTELNNYFAANDIDNSANRIKRAIEDTSGSLQRFYVQVERGDKSVETLTYALNEQGTAYEYLGKTIREADNSTDFRRKDLGTQWSIQSERLIQFANNAEKAGLASTALKDDIKALFASLNRANPDNGGNTLTMNAFLDDFDIARAKLQALNAEARKNNFAEALQIKIKKLSADMNSFAQANERATESQKKMSTGQTFAEEWVRLTNQMAKGANLTDSELKKLQGDFRVFGKEAEAAGLKGETAFGKFANSFKLLSTYFSASRLIWRTISEIKSAVNELRTLNDTIIEIDKVSGRTQDNLRTLAESSFQVASEFGRTANDYLLGVQEMSRAGFGEKQAEEFAKLGLMAQAAGQLTAEMANEYLIATNAAYNLGGNEEKLNQILDSQNYLANNNAVNMENLAEATKLAGSQAAASGVAIDELTAAVGTMVATTQQGGSQAGRAFKGILMNIQQVKASADEIGDGGADITAESLSKYEKATAALGVSLKEVKNGTLQLRKPMEVLRDLSVAVSKESEGSIKVANLISAVGGKFRGNQLIALLQNWDVYEKMLTEFNSDEAVGSAMREAEKSADGWSGSLNKVKNSWTELVQSFAQNENMISMLDSINAIIQSVSSSAASGGLSILSDSVTTLLNGVELLAKTLGVFPTLLSGIMVALSAKSGGIFGYASQGITGIIGRLQETKTYLGSIKNLWSNWKIDLSGLSQKDIGLLQNYVNVLNKVDASQSERLDAMANMSDAARVQAGHLEALNNAYRNGTITEEQYTVGTQNLAAAQRAATVTSKALAVALNVVKNVLITFAISAIIKGLNEIVDKLIVTSEELEEIRDKSVNSISALKQSIEKLSDETDTITDLVKKYKEISSSVDISADARDQLIQIQNDLIDKFGEEANGIDLVNGKYDEQIEKINELKNTNYNEWLRENASGIKEAEDLLNYDIGWISRYESTVQDQGHAQYYLRGVNNGVVDSFYKIQSLSNDIKRAFKDVEGVSRTTGFKSTIYLSGSIEEARKQLGQLIDEYSKLDNIDNNTLTKLSNHYTKLSEAIESANYTMQKKASLETTDFNVISRAALSFTETLKSLINVSGDELLETWLATLDDMQKGSLKNISTMVSALQDLSEGKGIAANTFWNLIEFDTEGLLSGAKLVGDKFYITQENMIKLKDKYVQKQIDEIKLQQTGIENEKKRCAEIAKRLQLEIEAWKFSEKSLTNPVYQKEYDELLSQLESAKQSAKAYGDEWERNNWLIEYLNQSLGNTVDKQKELESQAKALNKEITALNKELDNYVKAHEAVIDNIVKGIEREQHELEEQKQVLEDELDVLNEQKDTIEETIKNYESVNKLVQDTVEKEIDALEKQKKSIEDTYNKRIDALKSENEEREDALEYAEKLRNLENARNNKRRVYDETRGWRYESVKDDVVKAENELAEFENSQQIKALEKERDSITEALDEQIDTKKEYAELWKEVLDAIQTEEEELLAVEILGADWREKIANGDIEVMEKFRTEYLSHNTALQNLTKNEIKLKEEAIKAKDAEIDAKKKQAQAWKDYKTEITTAVTEIKNANEGYMSQLGQIELNEGSSLEDRERVFETFKNNVTGYINQIAGAQSQLDYINSLQENLGGDYHYNIEVNGKEDLEEAAAASLALALGAASVGALGGNGAFAGTLGIGAAMSVANSPIPDMTNDIINAITDVMNHIRGFSQGGVVDRTGLAMLHGRQNAPELIFNAKDSSKLYDMVHNTPNLIASIISDARKLAGFKVGNNTSNTSSVVNFHIDKIVTDNPEDFSKQMEKYYQTKLTQSYTTR